MDRLTNDQKEQRGFSRTEILLTSSKTLTILDIVSYVLLIITTSIVGFNILKNFKIPFINRKISTKEINILVTSMLIIVWCILLSVQIIKLKKGFY